MNSSICFILIIIDLKVIKKKFLNLPNLSEAQVSYIYKLLQVVMIYKYKNFMLKAP